MSDPQELIDAALAASVADGCVVIASEHSETNLRWAANSLTTSGQMRSRSLTVISTFDASSGTRVGVRSKSITSVEEVTELVRASEAAGLDADPAEDGCPLVEAYPHDDDWDAAPARTSVEVFDAFAPQLAATFRGWTDADLLLYGFAEHQMTSYFLATSTGLRRRFDQPDGRMELNGKSADLRRSVWSGAHSGDFADIDVAAAAHALQQQLGWAERQLELPAGRYETVLPPTAVADLMIYLYWTASARDADEGRSVFAAEGGGTRIGEKFATLPLTLRSDPTAAGLQCPPFDIALASAGGLQSVFDNGQPVPAASWIERGTLNDLVRTRSWAERTGTTARPLVDNLILECDGATAGLEQMVADTERGLLLTSLWYIREVDPQTLLLTGLTRDGVYLIEDGQVQGAVNNFRFNESPVDLLARANEAGACVPTLPREWSDDFRRTAMSPLRIPDFNMSTMSRAS